jgi:hypothetical protein
MVANGVQKNGEERIRTSGYIAASSDFKSDAIDHSATSPKEDQLGLIPLNFTHLYYPNLAASFGATIILERSP